MSETEENKTVPPLTVQKTPEQPETTKVTETEEKIDSEEERVREHLRRTDKEHMIEYIMKMQKKFN